MKPVFRDAEAEVWRISMDTDAPASPDTLSNMSATDRARYERFILPSEKTMFAESRRILSFLIARSDLVVPDAKVFRAENSRPVFSSETGAHISWSRSGSCLAVVISTAGPVGIDIEHRRKISFGPMLSIISHEDEHAAFLRLPSKTQPEAFLRLWTIKEAVLKALGTGFQTSPKLINPPVGAYANSPVGTLTLACLGQHFRIAVFEDEASVMGLARLV